MRVATMLGGIHPPDGGNGARADLGSLASWSSLPGTVAPTQQPYYYLCCQEKPSTCLPTYVPAYIPVGRERKTKLHAALVHAAQNSTCSPRCHDAHDLLASAPSTSTSSGLRTRQARCDRIARTIQRTGRPSITQCNSATQRHEAALAMSTLGPPRMPNTTQGPL